MEVELKLLIDPVDVALFRRHPLIVGLAIAAPRTRSLTSFYFDSPDLFFRKHGAALRVRRVDRRWLQTLKAGNSSASGLHERDEWETRVSGPRPELSALREVSALSARWQDLLSDETLAAPLIPIFATRFRRTAWALRFDDGGEAELALDQGAIQCDGKRAAISEVELELKAGSPRMLFDFALELEETLALRVSSVTKSARGYALLASDSATAPVVRAESVAFDAGATIASGMRAIVGSCIAQVQGNEAGQLKPKKSRACIKCASGVRRLRSALKLFDLTLPCPASLIAEIKWLAEALGNARDWEVLSTATLAKVEGVPDRLQLHEAVSTEVARQRRVAAEVVQSRRYARLLLVLGQWLQRTHDLDSMPAESSIALRQPLDVFAAMSLKRLHARLVRRASMVDRTSAEALHELRKFARRVRYASEFLKPYQRPGEVRRYVKLLIGVQDELGRTNDAVVAGRLLAEIAGKDESIRDSAMFASGFLACGARLKLDRLDDRLEKLARTRRPRRFSVAT